MASDILTNAILDLLTGKVSLAQKIYIICDISKEIICGEYSREDQQDLEKTFTLGGVVLIYHYSKLLDKSFMFGIMVSNQRILKPLNADDTHKYADSLRACGVLKMEEKERMTAIYLDYITSGEIENYSVRTYSDGLTL